MFGYVRARQDLLAQSDLEAYEALYCGLCHTMAREYGRFSRLFLNYDFAFLAMLLAPAGSECPGADCRRCPRHPVKGKNACGETGWLSTAAAESVILTWWKLRDTVADGGFFKALGARFLCLPLGRAYRRAKAACPDFDAQTADLLAELRELEEERSPSIDQTADCFARLLRAAAPETGEDRLDRPRAQLLYHLGRWIYLVDAVDDMAEDRTSGNYNPVRARFPEWTGEDKEYLRTSLDRSLDLMGAAFQLLDEGPYRAVLENILYAGLPNVEELVFMGKWREAQKRPIRKGEKPHE